MPPLITHLRPDSNHPEAFPPDDAWMHWSMARKALNGLLGIQCWSEHPVFEYSEREPVRAKRPLTFEAQPPLRLQPSRPQVVRSVSPRYGIAAACFMLSIAAIAFMMQRL